LNAIKGSPGRAIDFYIFRGIRMGFRVNPRGITKARD